MSYTIRHLKVTGGAVDTRYSVDLHDWDDDHILTGFASASQGGTGVVNNDSSTLTISGAFGTTFTVSATTSLTLPASGTLATLAGSETFTNKTLTTPVINGLPTGTGVSSGANASTLASRTADGVSSFVNVLMGYQTTVTAAGTSTLTVGSQQQQFFTGTTTQTVTLPVTSTLTLGQSFDIINNSTGIVTVNSSGANAVATVPGGGRVRITCILTSGTDAASWSVEANYLSVAGGKRPQISNTIIFAGTDGTTQTFQATDTIVGRATTDTLTNKTFNSTGTGNTLQVSGVTVSAGQYPGETTTGNATAGNVGQYIESVVVVGSAIALTTATTANITSISVPAGDWDISASVNTLGTGTTSFTSAIGSISQTTATLDTAPLAFGIVTYGTGQVLPATTQGVLNMNVGPVRKSFSGTTTVYLVTQATFTASTATSWGTIRARRVR